MSRPRSKEVKQGAAPAPEVSLDLGLQGLRAAVKPILAMRVAEMLVPIAANAGPIADFRAAEAAGDPRLCGPGHLESLRLSVQVDGSQITTWP